MKGVRWAAVLISAALTAPHLSAQGFINPYPDPYCGFSSRPYRYSHFGLSIGGYYNPYCGPPAYGYVTNRVTVVITLLPPPVLVPSGRFGLDELELALLREHLLVDFRVLRIVELHIAARAQLGEIVDQLEFLGRGRAAAVAGGATALENFQNAGAG